MTELKPRRPARSEGKGKNRPRYLERKGMPTLCPGHERPRMSRIKPQEGWNTGQKRGLAILGGKGTDRRPQSGKIKSLSNQRGAVKKERSVQKKEEEGTRRSGCYLTFPRHYKDIQTIEDELFGDAQEKQIETHTARKR